MIGVKRNIAPKAKLMLDMFPVVTLLGARQVGKTTLAKSLMPSGKYIDLENPDDFDLLTQNPTLFFSRYPNNVIIDEAQIYPELFGILRSVVDTNRAVKGRFIVTGSSSPDLLSQTADTLAGRVGILEVGTLKANEYYNQPLSPLYDLFLSPLSPERLPMSAPPLSSHEIDFIWLKGGYPEPLLNKNPLFYNHWMENYRDTYINRDIARLFPKLNKTSYRRFLTILSKLSGTILNKRDVGRALEVSETTIKQYIDIVTGTFLWRTLPSFEKNIVKSIIKMPKGYIRDSGLLHYLVKISSLDDLITDPLVGASFESFVIEEILKGIEATSVTNWQPFYYRTRNGAEIDLILDGPFGVLPIEIKYGSSVKIKQISALIQFVEDHCLPFGMVVNHSRTIEWIHPRIIQVPVGWI